MTLGMPTDGSLREHAGSNTTFFQKRDLYTGVVLALHTHDRGAVFDLTGAMWLFPCCLNNRSERVPVWARVAIHRLSSPYMSGSTGDQAAAAQVSPNV